MTAKVKPLDCIGMLIPRFSAAILKITPADRWPGRKFVAIKFAKCKHETTRKLKWEYY